MYSGVPFENCDYREVIDRAKVNRRVRSLMSIYGRNDESNSFIQNLENYLANPDFNRSYKPEFEARFLDWTEEEIKLFISLYTEAHEKFHLNQAHPEIMARANAIESNTAKVLEQD